MDSTNGERASRIATGAPQPSGGGNTGLASDLGTATAAVLISLLIGTTINACRDEPLPWKYQDRAQTMDAAVTRLQETPGPTDAPSAADPTHEVRLEEFQPFVTGHRGPVLDARAAVFYREGHVPGAWSLPRETFTDDYPQLRVRLESYRDKTVAVYCSGPDCPDAQLVADALTRLGYQKLVIYTSGWEEWSHTGLPQEGAAATP